MKCGVHIVKMIHSIHFKKISCLVLAIMLTAATFPVLAAGEGSDIPLVYYFAAKHQGSIEKVTYKTEHNGREITKDALVYLPYGYNKNDTSTKYDILYLVHGSGGDETTYMNSSFKNMIDNMIENGNIKPLIIVTPTINEGSDDYESEFDEFPQELTNDLMPTVESTYNTYSDGTTADAFKASRSHRAFGGFSMGGMVTWDVMIEDMDYFKYFLPMSGDYESVYEEDLEAANESADIIGAAVSSSGHTADDFRIFAASGSDDFMCDRVKDQINAMKYRYPSLFTSSNTTFYEAADSQHDFHYSFEYIYNALPHFFR